MSRRFALTGLLTAPAIIRSPGLLMRVPRRRLCMDPPAPGEAVTDELLEDLPAMEEMLAFLQREMAKACGIPLRYLTGHV